MNKQLIRKHSFRYYGNRVIEGNLYDTEHGVVFEMPRKKQQVRKDTGILKEFTPTNGDDVYQKLKDNHHPNVMKLFDFTDKHLYVEFVDGFMLYHTYEWEPKELYRGYDGVEFWFPTRPYVEGMDQAITDGLAHLHSIGVYHGDFKSNNIMVDKNGQLKIIDFHASIALGPDYVDYTKDISNLKKTLKGLEKYKK
mgnify:CR=1 FL=1